MTCIQIHEFSTGIRPQIAVDGSWVSLGFIGLYMNVTIDPIPRAVECSIANKEFAIAEGASSDEPAVIGRVVQDSEESDWSVVAVVIRGQDEYGRSAPFYRYFLCEGRDSLWKILAWMEEYEQKNGHKPIFNPSETKELRQSHPFQASTALTNPLNPLTDLLESTSIPIIIPPDRQYTLQEINALATAKANSQPISWAFNAKALEKPWSFIVIQAASDRACDLLRRTVANTPKVQTPVVADEQALKLAIKTLIDDSDVKPEAVQVIADALENDQITKDYWHTLFDSQGAKDALNQKIYNPQMARLLTLRALVIPDTLQQYLDWLNLKKNLNKRSSNLTIISALEFPSNLRSLLIGFPHITRNLTQILELLTANRSSVSLFYKLGDYIHQYSSDSSFSIFYYQLSAYFEQKNNNIVSKSLFNKAFIGTSSCQEDIFGLTVYKERSRIVQYKADTLPIPVVILLVVCSLCLGVGGGFFIGKSHHNQSASNLPKTANAPEPSSAFSGISQINSSNELALTELPEEIEKKASEEFPTTVKAIKQAVQEIQKNQDIPEEQVIQQITNILGDGGLSLDYEGVIEDKLLKQSDKYNFKKKQWIFAIYSYQQKLGVQEEVGYIKPGGDTAKFLKKQVVEQPKTIPKNLAPN